MIIVSSLESRLPAVVVGPVPRRRSGTWPRWRDRSARSRCCSCCSCASCRRSRCPRCASSRAKTCDEPPHMSDAPHCYGLLAGVRRSPTRWSMPRARTPRSDYRDVDAYAPYLGRGPAPKRSASRSNRVPLITLLGGIAGGAGAYFLQWYTRRGRLPDQRGRPAAAQLARVHPGDVRAHRARRRAGRVRRDVCCSTACRACNHPMFNAPDFDLASRNRFFLASARAIPASTLGARATSWSSCSRCASSRCPRETGVRARARGARARRMRAQLPRHVRPAALQAAGREPAVDRRPRVARRRAAAPCRYSVGTVRRLEQRTTRTRRRLHRAVPPLAALRDDLRPAAGRPAAEDRR